MEAAESPLPPPDEAVAREDFEELSGAVPMRSFAALRDERD
jgi:hypothetical protein